MLSRFYLGFVRNCEAFVFRGVGDGVALRRDCSGNVTCARRSVWCIKRPPHTIYFEGRMKLCI